MLLCKQQHTQKEICIVVYAEVLHWLCARLPKICNVFKKPWFEYMNSSIYSLDLKYFEIILKCMFDCAWFIIIYIPFIINRRQIGKVKKLISNAAIDIRLRYPRYSTTWSSRYSHTASIILTAFSPSSCPWALPQSYGLPGKTRNVSSNIIPTISQIIQQLRFIFYPLVGLDD